MTSEKLREVWRASPFQPFTIHLGDGRSFHVPHPEFMTMTRGGRLAVVTHDDEGMDIIDLLLVTSIEVKPSSSAA